MAFCLSREGLRGADYKTQALIESSNAHMLKKTLLQVTTFDIQSLTRCGKEATNFIAHFKAQ